MRCPVCGSYQSEALAMKAGQFEEELRECRVCASQWSVSHGLSEVVRDSQKDSFLSGMSETVEADDYTWAA